MILGLLNRFLPGPPQYFSNSLAFGTTSLCFIISLCQTYCAVDKICDHEIAVRWDVGYLRGSNIKPCGDKNLIKQHLMLK